MNRPIVDNLADGLKLLRHIANGGQLRSQFPVACATALLREFESPPLADMSHLDAVQLRRIIERHVRWRNQASRILEQVNTGYKGEWPEIAEFLRNTASRPVLASPTTPEPK